MLGLSVALSAGTTFAAQEGNDTESTRRGSTVGQGCQCQD